MCYVHGVMKRNDVSGIESGLAVLFEDEVFVDFGWSRQYNEKKGRKDAFNMKTFNVFIKGMYIKCILFNQDY